MKALVIGAGNMGRTVAYDLLTNDDVEHVVIADKSRDNLDLAIGELGRIEPKLLDLDDVLSKDYVNELDGFDVVVNCSDYKYNADLTMAAIQARTNMCDLGGNIHVVEEQMRMHHAARNAGVTIIPDCGLAPGFAGLLAAKAVENIGGTADSVKIFVGGLPAEPKPPLNYKLVFSARGLINEYVEPCKILVNGGPKTVEPLTEIEKVGFPAPYGTLEAFHTSGGSSTLVHTMQNKVTNLSYKTLRYPGHVAIFQGLKQLGFLDEKREVLEEQIINKLSDSDTDVVLVHVEAINYGSRDCYYQIIDKFDVTTGHSAMARMTAYPTAIIAHMLGSWSIEQKGVLPGETCIPLDRVIEGMQARGISLTKGSKYDYVYGSAPLE